MSLSLTRTFLFTDIEGSTKLWEAHHDAMQVALARHDVLVGEAIAQHNGVVFKTIGDAFCAAFENPVDAAQAALAAQKSLATEAWPDPVEISVRMAVHTGVAECRNDDYFGPPLNRVARLLSIGHGGQTLLSVAAYELSRDQLPEGLSLTDLGEHRLKDLIRPEHVFQLTAPGLTERFPALRSLNSFPNNLPQQLTSFLGREKGLSEVSTLLASSRLVTLTGSGGCGKSRLALQLGADLLERFPDGVWFVELAPLSDPALLPQAVAGAMGIADLPGEPSQALCQALHDRKLLLILDNCEHLIQHCSQLANALLRVCPELTILATSREALLVSGEMLFRVPSLSLPDRHPPPPADKLSQFTAVQLFVERAQAVRADFMVTNANAPAVAEICWRLDGIPMAIELAAARLRNMGIEDLLTRLEDRFRIITGGSNDRLPRQKTLRALVDWSYDLLTEQEQLLLARLSVFVGGWTLEAAEGICSGDTIEDWEVLDLLSSLVDKSLVLLDQGRYKMLETIKKYAEEKAKDQTEQLREQHFAWFKQKVETQFRKFNYENHPTAYGGLIPEQENLLSALRLARERADGESILILAGYPKHAWIMGSYCSEVKQYLREVHVRLSDAPDSILRAFTLVAEAMYAQQLGTLEEAILLAEEGLAMHRRLDDEVGISDALCLLGVTYNLLARFDESIACFQEAILLNQKVGQVHWEFTCYGNRGYVYVFSENWEAAEQDIQRSLQEPNSDQNPYVHGARLDCLADLYSRTGRIPESLATYRQAIVTNRSVQNWREVSGQLGAFARLALLENQTERSVRLHGANAALRRRYFMSAFPHEQAALDQDLEKARKTLSPEDFEKAWTAGLALSVDEAITDALRDEGF